MKHLLTLSLSVFLMPLPTWAAPYGHYLPERVGSQGDLSSRAILFQPDREWFCDFDGTEALSGVKARGGTVEPSKEWYMMGGQSLKWNGGPGDVLAFEVGMKIQGAGKGFAYGAQHHLSFGVFLETRADAQPSPALKATLLDPSGTVLYEDSFYLHKTGWNILDVVPEIKPGTTVGSLEVTRVSGGKGPLFIDSAFLFLKPKGVGGLATAGILKTEIMGGMKRSAMTALTAEEKKAFSSIADRILPPLEKVAKLDEKKMSALVAFAEGWEVKSRGGFANGKFPLYYYRAVPGDLVQDSSTYFMYKENSELCGRLKDLGQAYAMTGDAAQKTVLGKHLADLVRLATTFGGMPNAWYNGRGFVEGVFYGREVLEKEGLLGPIARQCILQYGVDLMVAADPVWERPPLEPGKILDPSKVEFEWSSTADDINTGSRSTWLCPLLMPDGPEKAAFLGRLSAWYSRVAFAWAPNANGTLKPDGSWFHHWGNRFDGYGWQAAFRGASDVRWWLSGTAFQLEPEALARLDRMAEVYAKVVFRDGTYGTPDNFHPGSGVSNGNTFAHNILLNYGMAKDGETAGKGPNPWARAFLGLAGGLAKETNKGQVSEWQARGMEPLVTSNAVVTLSYAGIQFRRGADWSLSIRGTSSAFYHTQYEREGSLFYNIGGMGFLRQGQPHSMWADPKKWELLGRHDPKMLRVAPGYHLSYAPMVTAFEAPWENLKTLYYQRGAGSFVGGLCLGDTHGLFVQVFDAASNSSFEKTPAAGLSFQKTYFTFDRTVVCLGRGIRGEGRIFTGVLQEPSLSGVPGIAMAGGTEAFKKMSSPLDSRQVPWAEVAGGSLGVWFYPGQRVVCEDGNLAAGPRSGAMTRLYLQQDPGASTVGASYGVVYLIQPERGATEAFATAMAGRSPPVTILRDDASVIAVAHGPTGATGYAFFARAKLPAPSPVASADVPCLVMARPEGTRGLRLSVSDPDMNNARTAENPFGYSLPTTVHLVLKGSWALDQVLAITGTGTPSVVALPPKDGETAVEVTVKDGLSTEMILTPR